MSCRARHRCGLRDRPYRPRRPPQAQRVSGDALEFLEPSCEKATPRRALVAAEGEQLLAAADSRRNVLSPDALAILLPPARRRRPMRFPRGHGGLAAPCRWPRPTDAPFHPLTHWRARSRQARRPRSRRDPCCRGGSASPCQWRPPTGPASSIVALASLLPSARRRCLKRDFSFMAAKCEQLLAASHLPQAQRAIGDPLAILLSSGEKATPQMGSSSTEGEQFLAAGDLPQAHRVV